MMAPRASTGRTWLASSNTTRSKATEPGGMYLAIDSGLIMKTGLMLWMARPASFMSRRTAM